MAQIHGKVESIKKLQYELKSYGINRFNSIKEINDFLYFFQQEKESIIKTQLDIFLNEVNNLKLKIKEEKNKCEILKSRTLAEIEVKLETMKINMNFLIEQINKSIIHKIFYSYKLKKQKKLFEYFKSYAPAIISNAIKNIQEIIVNDENKLKYLIENKELVVNKRSSVEIERLNYIKKTIEDLHPLISGAIGEEMVVEEIKKLPDDYILINDFNLKFNPPIYNKNTNDRIFSIQIDHLLISKSGIYILETKNWSKKSVESLDLRSPVEQITRTSYALFLILNDSKIRLTEHHWGDKQIPIRNIIVMINEKPKADFKYVKVKSIRELNKYLTYFEPIFNENEINRIAKYLLQIQN